MRGHFAVSVPLFLSEVTRHTGNVRTLAFECYSARLPSWFPDYLASHNLRQDSLRWRPNCRLQVPIALTSRVGTEPPATSRPIHAGAIDV